MTDSLGARLRLTVLGCSTAAPDPTTPTAGFLVEWGGTAILLDVGQGVIRNLQRVLDPHDLSGIVIGHMHADHYLDIVVRNRRGAEVVDVDEFVAAVAAGLLSPTTAEAAMHRTHRALDGIAAHGHDLDAWLGELGIRLSWKPR